MGACTTAQPPVRMKSRKSERVGAAALQMPTTQGSSARRSRRAQFSMSAV
jgi:hypothetical protein